MTKSDYLKNNGWVPLYYGPNEVWIKKEWQNSPNKHILAYDAQEAYDRCKKEIEWRIHDEQQVSNAVKIICHALINDPSYYIGWHSNISVCFQDQIKWDLEKGELDQSLLHIDMKPTADRAATAFLNLLKSDENVTD